MKLRSLTMWAAATAGCLTLTLLPAAAATAQTTDEPSPTSVKVTAPQVQPKVTRLLFAVPQTLDELKVSLAGLKPLLLRYTGEVGGGDQPGPGVPADQAIESMRKSVVGQYGVEPLVFLVVMDGEVPAAHLTALEPVLAEAKTFDSDSESVDRLPLGTLEQAADATRAREALLGRSDAMKAAAEESREDAPSSPSSSPSSSSVEPTTSANISNAWAPWYGTMRAYNNPYESPTDMPRKFRHYLRWYSASDIAAFGDDFAYEHNMSLYNTDLWDLTRPYCADSAYTEFWAGWSTGFKWNAVKYGWNFPSAAAAYWDWDDTTDSCQKLDFSVGIGYPKKLTAGVAYNFWIAAEKGNKSSSPYDLGAQKISNDCNDLGMEPGSSCTGLNYDRPGSGTEPLVGKSRGWRVPSCADWVRGGSPTYKANGTYDCPANR